MKILGTISSSLFALLSLAGCVQIPPGTSSDSSALDAHAFDADAGDSAIVQNDSSSDAQSPDSAPRTDASTEAGPQLMDLKACSRCTSTRDCVDQIGESWVCAIHEQTAEDGASGNCLPRAELSAPGFPNLSDAATELGSEGGVTVSVGLPISALSCRNFSAVQEQSMPCDASESSCLFEGSVCAPSCSPSEAGCGEYRCTIRCESALDCPSGLRCEGTLGGSRLCTRN